MRTGPLPDWIRTLRRAAGEISPARIAGTVTTVSAHVAAALFFLAPDATRVELPPAQEIVTVVDFIPAEGRELTVVPPAPPPKAKPKPAPPAPPTRAIAAAPPADTATPKPAPPTPETVLVGSPEVASVDLAAPDNPPSEILSYRSSHAPAFPAEAREAGEGGWVTLRVLVDADGVPSAVVLVRSTAPERLIAAAVEAIRQWRFNPATRGGIAVPAWVEVPIGFYNSRQS